MNEVVEDINSTHMGPWIDLCSVSIAHTTTSIKW